MRKLLACFFFIFMSMNASVINAQSVNFDFNSNPGVDFSFNTIAKYTNGIIIPNAVTLDVVATGTQWDLYVGTTTVTAGTWDNTQYYSPTGNGFPPVGLLQIAVRNAGNTSQLTGFVPLQDIATSTLNIIGNRNSAPDPPIHCSDAVHQGTNTAGSYITDPQCYQFNIDFKIVPGLNYKAGIYTLRVDFILARDL